MFWDIVAIIYVIAWVFVIYELITAPLSKDDEKPVFFSEENTNNSDDTEVTTE